MSQSHQLSKRDMRQHARQNEANHGCIDATHPCQESFQNEMCCSLAMYVQYAAHVCNSSGACLCRPCSTVLGGCMPARPLAKFSIAVPILSVRWVVLSGMDIHLVYELPRTTVLQNCTLQPNTLYNKSIPSRADIASAATFRNHTYKRCLRYSDSCRKV